MTLPAIGPALMAAGLLTVISGVGMFSVPIVIGTGARIDVLSVRIFRLLGTSFPPRTGVALILAAMMLIVVRHFSPCSGRSSGSGQHAAIGGRGFRDAPVALGPWKLWARAAGIAYVVATAVLPAVGLLLVSVQRFWTPDVRWNQLTFANYQFVLLQNRDTSHSLLNSLLLGLTGSTLTMLLAAVLMLQVQVANGSGRRLVDAITALPATIPHTVVGVSFLVAFGRPPLPLYGTVYILLLAYVAMQTHMPRAPPARLPATLGMSWPKPRACSAPPNGAPSRRYCCRWRCQAWPPAG